MSLLKQMLIRLTLMTYAVLLEIVTHTEVELMVILAYFIICWILLVPIIKLFSDYYMLLVLVKDPVPVLRVIDGGVI